MLWHLGGGLHGRALPRPVYVDGDVHTNTIEGFWIEGFWALVKGGGLSGVYRSLSTQHFSRTWTNTRSATTTGRSLSVAGCSTPFFRGS